MANSFFVAWSSCFAAVRVGSQAASRGLEGEAQTPGTLRPAHHRPLLLGLLLVRGIGVGHEHAGARSVTCVVRRARTRCRNMHSGTAGGREGGLRAVLVEAPRAFLAPEVTAAPDACSDPDTDDGNDKNHDADDPPPVIRNPISAGSLVLARA